MKSWKTPTPEQVEKAVAQLGHGEYNRYFFDRLQNPEWLRPLKAKHFFAKPPQPVRDEAQGTIAFPPWPESRYLARMAQYAPETVLEIIKAIPLTDNSHVHADFADAAIAMPSAVAAKLVPQAKEWIKSPYQMSLARKLGALVSSLALNGQRDAALDLFEALLEVSPDPKPVLVPQPRPRFDSWQYQELLRKNVPDLVTATGIRVLEVLCKILARVLRLSHENPDREDAEDYSSIWRPAIDYDSVSSREVAGALVSAVRDSATELVARNIADVGKVVQILEKQSWRVFHRLALHILNVFADRATDLITQRLGQPERFDNPGIRREYNLLAMEWFDRIGASEQEKILNWIDRGPDLEFFKERWASFTGQAVTDEDAQRFKKQWQRDRLATLRAKLSEKWRLYFDQLVSEVGRPGDLTEAQQIKGGAFAPESSKNRQDLARLSVSEAIDYLRNWQPSDESSRGTIAGLAREFGATVASNSEAFVARARELSSLDPTYVREFFQALTDLAKRKSPFEWKEVLGLARLVVEQPREVPSRKGGLTDRDPDWGWTRSSIARMLAAGFETDTLPFTLRHEVWTVIEPLTKDPDPTAADEEHYLQQKNGEPSSLAINSTRGEAMSDVVRYALWVRRNVESGENGAERLTKGLEEMPEVKQVLDDHLNLETDSSLAIRSVYGMWLPWLQLIDRAWVVKSLSKIFPNADCERRLRDSAWTAYIVHPGAYNDVFDMLKGEYLDEIDQIGKHFKVQSHLGDPDEMLADHLMTMYWRGKLSIDDPVLQRFFLIATDRLRGRAVEFVGKSLRNNVGEIAADIIERLRNLWATRLHEARSASDSRSYVDEMSRFGWWFVSKKFDDNWALDQLLESLKIAGKVDPDFLVVERLAEISASMSGKAVECLSLIVEGDKEGWGVLGWKKSAYDVLAAAIRSDDHPSVVVATKLINKLGSRGYFDFRELLPV